MKVTLDTIVIAKEVKVSKQGKAYVRVAFMDNTNLCYAMLNRACNDIDVELPTKLTLDLDITLGQNHKIVIDEWK